VSLMKHGHVGYVVSTNIDGLHLRSGIPRDKLAELHGNGYLEKCSKCKKEYLRNFDCSKELRKDHHTVRTCEVESCGGPLLDSIVHFGENLPEQEFNNADIESRKGDVAIVLGTSLRVFPANSLPSRIYGKLHGRMIICNLQKTPYDEHAALRIQAYVDDILGLLLEELGITVDLNTPEGIQAHKWVNRMDEVYPEKIKEMQQKLEKRKTIVRNKLSGLTINANNIAIRTNHLISKQFGVTKSITDASRNQLVFFKNCINCNLELQNECTKVIIEGCNDSQFHIKSQVVTNMCEVINCNNVIINIHTPIYTVTVDACKNVKVTFQSAYLMKMLVTTKSEGVTLKVAEDELHEVKHDINSNDLDQYLTRIVQGKILTELVLRECEGMFTTAREKALDEEAAAANAAAMGRYLAGAIRFTDKKT